MIYQPKLFFIWASIYKKHYIQMGFHIYLKKKALHIVQRYYTVGFVPSMWNPLRVYKWPRSVQLSSYNNTVQA